MIYKTKKERLIEVLKVRRQFANFGFPENDEIIKFNKILSQWVSDGIYQKGKLKLRGYERIIVYELYVRKGTEIAVNLIFEKGL